MTFKLKRANYIAMIESTRKSNFSYVEQKYTNSYLVFKQLFFHEMQKLIRRYNDKANKR